MNLPPQILAILRAQMAKQQPARGGLAHMARGGPAPTGYWDEDTGNYVEYPTANTPVGGDSPVDTSIQQAAQPQQIQTGGMSAPARPSFDAPVTGGSGHMAAPTRPSFDAPVSSNLPTGTLTLNAQDAATQAQAQTAPVAGPEPQAAPAPDLGIDSYNAPGGPGWALTHGTPRVDTSHWGAEGIDYDVPPSAVNNFGLTQAQLDTVNQVGPGRGVQSGSMAAPARPRFDAPVSSNLPTGALSQLPAAGEDPVEYLGGSQGFDEAQTQPTISPEIGSAGRREAPKGYWDEDTGNYVEYGQPAALTPDATGPLTQIAPPASGNSPVDSSVPQAPQPVDLTPAPDIRSGPAEMAPDPWGHQPGSPGYGSPDRQETTLPIEQTVQTRAPFVPVDDPTTKIPDVGTITPERPDPTSPVSGNSPVNPSIPQAPQPQQPTSPLDGILAKLKAMDPNVLRSLLQGGSQPTQTVQYNPETTDTPSTWGKHVYQPRNIFSPTLGVVQPQATPAYQPYKRSNFFDVGADKVDNLAQNSQGALGQVLQSIQDQAPTRYYR